MQHKVIVKEKENSLPLRHKSSQLTFGGNPTISAIYLLPPTHRWLSSTLLVLVLEAADVALRSSIVLKRMCNLTELSTSLPPLKEVLYYLNHCLCHLFILWLSSINCSTKLDLCFPIFRSSLFKKKYFFKTKNTLYRLLWNIIK